MIKQEIIELIREVNAEAPFLPDGLDLSKYVDKLLQNAVILPVFEQGRLKAFISFYCNDTASKKSYFTILVLTPELRKKGMGSFLMEAAMEYARKNDFEIVETQVYKANQSSYKMCERLGFSIKEDKGDSYILTKQIK